jgi:hypothetical protein
MNGSENLIKVVAHLKIVYVQSLRPGECDISYALLLLIDQSLQRARFDAP